MTLALYTARFWISDPDRFDITRGSGEGIGLFFAPTWAILRPALAAREEAKIIRRTADAQAEIDARRVEEDAWAAYVPAYTAEMRASYVRHRPAWDAVAARERVVFVCKCPRRERCHRGLLAPMFVAAYGAVDHGEIA